MNELDSASPQFQPGSAARAASREWRDAPAKLNDYWLASHSLFLSIDDSAHRPYGCRSTRLPNNVARLAMLSIATSSLLGASVTFRTAYAQAVPTVNYTRFDATPESEVQLGYYASANADCTPARRPTIRVIESPRLGTLKVQPGDLTTDRFARCPQVTSPARVVSYEARRGEGATDRLVYEVTYANGDVRVYQVTIDIAGARKPNSE